MYSLCVEAACLHVAWVIAKLRVPIFVVQIVDVVRPHRNNVRGFGAGCLTASQMEDEPPLPNGVQ